MKTKLSLLLVCIMTTMCVFAQRETKHPFDRENLRERKMKTEVFSLRERIKSEMRNNRNPISTQQSNVATHRLDSIISKVLDEGVKFEFSYDNHGRLTAWIEYYWSHNTWRGDLKEEYTYDSNGNITTWISYYWAHNAWRGETKVEYTYDNNGNLTMWIEYLWDLGFTNTWREYWKGELVYDESGNLITENFFVWFGSSWGDFSRREYTYDSNGNLIMQMEYRYWDNSWWSESGKTEFVYDNNGNLITRIVYFGRGSVLNWELFKEEKEEFEYDDNGNLIARIEYRWWNDIWNESRKTEYTYDSNGNLTRQANYSWWSDEWEGRSKTEFIYDTSGNLTTTIEYRFNWTNRVLVEDWKTEYEFDLSVSANYIFFPYIFFENVLEISFSNPNKMIGIRDYEWRNNAWQKLDGIPTFHYSEIPTNIPNISANSFTIFPNPVFDSFQISGITENTLVKISDLHGRILLQQTVAPNEQILVGHLSAGIYFVRMNGETAKIVKR